MTAIDVRDVEAGPLVDAACAKAMGWKSAMRGDWLFVSSKEWELGVPFAPSSDIAAAWELVEALEGAGIGGNIVRISNGDGDSRDVDVIPRGPVEMSKIVLARVKIDSTSQDAWAFAICRAFLLANGVTELETANIRNTGGCYELNDMLEQHGDHDSVLDRMTASCLNAALEHVDLFVLLDKGRVAFAESEEHREVLLSQGYVPLNIALETHGVDVLESTIRILAGESAESWSRDLLTEVEGDVLEKLLATHDAVLKQRAIETLEAVRLAMYGFVGEVPDLSTDVGRIFLLVMEQHNAALEQAQAEGYKRGQRDTYDELMSDWGLADDEVD